MPRLGEALLLCALRGLCSLAVYWAGFRALSDDDYARVAIAQRFASLPRFDPSQTSWLPLPFWLYGSVFRGLGTDLSVARATAITLSTGATLLVFCAARLLAASRPGALLAAALATLLPYSALLGIAAIPEVPCAALIVLGLATLGHSDARLRMLGGIVLSAASLSRYEAWPASIAFAAFSLFDAQKTRRPSLMIAAGLALLGPMIWLAVGHNEHGSALFFVARVANYRRALAASGAESLAERLLEYPRLLVSAEPELCALLLVVAMRWRVAPRALFGAYSRAGLALGAMLAFLVFGSVRDGVPTHHAARVLLPIWYLACIACGQGLAQPTAESSGRRRVVTGLLSAATIAIGLLLKPVLMQRESYAERALELAAGAEAKRRAVSALAIDTRDYGYFAIQAAFGAPGESHVLDDHDPRQTRSSSPFTDGNTLQRALRRRDARFLIATGEHAAIAVQVCSSLWHNSAFGLFQCPSTSNPP